MNFLKPGISSVKWKTIIALAAIIIALINNWDWLWGVLFLFWAINDLRNKSTYFVEPISRSENSFIYWVIIFMWIIFGIYKLIPDKFWWYFY
ncbi:MAG: hypothetical protein ACEPO8_09440 [Rhodothermaceae bacterium]